MKSCIWFCLWLLLCWSGSVVKNKINQLDSAVSAQLGHGVNCWVSRILLLLSCCSLIQSGEILFCVCLSACFREWRSPRRRNTKTWSLSWRVQQGTPLPCPCLPWRTRRAAVPRRMLCPVRTSHPWKSLTCRRAAAMVGLRKWSKRSSSSSWKRWESLPPPPPPNTPTHPTAAMEATGCKGGRWDLQTCWSFDPNT